MNEYGSKDLYTENRDELMRLENSVKEEEKNIDDCYFRIGKMYVAIHAEHGTYESDFAHLIAAVRNSKDNIAAIKRRQLELKGMIKCAKCGAEIPSYSAFCNVCGCAVEEALKSEPEIVSNDALEMEVRETLNDDSHETKDEVVISAEASESVSELPEVCPDCGTAIADDMLFCTNCGKLLAGEKAEAADNNEEETNIDSENNAEPSFDVPAYEEIHNTAAGEEVEEAEKEIDEDSAENEKSEKPMLICENCGKSLNEDSAFCEDCGAPVKKSEPDAFVSLEPAPAFTVSNKSEENKCVSCGLVLPENAIFCTECGTPVKKNEEIGFEEPVVPYNDEPATESLSASYADLGVTETNEMISSEPEAVEDSSKDEKRCDCGAVLEEGCAFCTECGKPVNSEAVMGAEEAVKTITEPEESSVVPAIEAVLEEYVSDNKKCSACGAFLEDDCVFCTNCGKPVEHADELKSGESEEKTESVLETEFDSGAEVVKEPETVSDVKKCSECGAILEPDCVFCTECGKLVADDKPENAAPAETGMPAATELPVTSMLSEETVAPASAPVFDTRAKCSNCGNPLDDFAKKCNVCGKPVFEALQMPGKNKCHRCGANLRGNLMYCIKCGAKLC